MLSLSTEAAPQLGLEALTAACRARGLDGEELVVAAGVDPEQRAADARAAGASIVALRVAEIDVQGAPTLARAAALLGVPVSVPAGALTPPALAAIVPAFAAAGARLLLGHGTDLDDALAVVAAIRAAGSPPSLGLAWELQPSAADLVDAGAILLATRELLGVVRLHGGGPEQRDQDGRGVGPLFVDLALTGYAGPIILCPSRPEELPRWAKWLASTGSAGCGHAVSGKTIELDVRDVEPRDRLETILGTYRLLVPGAAMHLTVDHDPVCMYYMLEATEPARSFAFQIVEHGPEVWRAEVTKR
jgi:uncharacterized protein (DUF2249 family)